MLAEFQAMPDIRGHRINLTWTWTAPGDRPALRLLRQRRAYPTGPEDGLNVLDLADPFWTPGRAWARIERTLYLGHGLTAESRLCHAQVHLYFDESGATLPLLAVITLYDSATDATTTVRIEEINRVERSQAAAPPWTLVKTARIFATQASRPSCPS